VGGLLEKLTSASAIDYRHMIRAGSATIVVTRSTGTNNGTYYVTQDHLSSSTAVTNSSGALLVNESFAAYGARRGSNWTGSPTSGDWTAIANTTRRGYTGHTDIDNLALIHMNGRVYDPMIGRFISADPFVDCVKNSQGFNRYSYVKNNPLTSIDPLGFEEESASPSDIDYIDAPPDVTDLGGSTVTGSRQNNPPPRPPRVAPISGGGAVGTGDGGHGSAQVDDVGTMTVTGAHPRSHDQGGRLILVNPRLVSSDADRKAKADCLKECFKSADRDANRVATGTGAAVYAGQVSAWNPWAMGASFLGGYIAAGFADELNLNDLSSHAVEGIIDLVVNRDLVGGAIDVIGGAAADASGHKWNPGMNATTTALSSLLAHRMLASPVGAMRAARFGFLAGAAYSAAYMLTFNWAYDRCANSLCGGP
jgi:RHS repeat-associated protein